MIKKKKKQTLQLWTDSLQLCSQPGEQRAGKFITFAPCEAGTARVPEQEINTTGEITCRSSVSVLTCWKGQNIDTKLCISLHADNEVLINYS